MTWTTSSSASSGERPIRLCFRFTIWRPSSSGEVRSEAQALQGLATICADRTLAPNASLAVFRILAERDVDLALGACRDLLTSPAGSVRAALCGWLLVRVCNRELDPALLRLPPDLDAEVTSALEAAALPRWWFDLSGHTWPHAVKEYIDSARSGCLFN